MAILSGSVGQNGKNLINDVRLIQKLLNLQNLTPLRKLSVDGRAGPATTSTIKHFQVVHVGMKNPDGRIDPGGRSFRKLNSERATKPNTSGITTPKIRKESSAARKDFVDPRVKETGITRKIINGISPRFSNVKARIISGYLSDTDLFWKVNYHWDYLLWMVEFSIGMDLEKKHKDTLLAIRSSLKACAPNPSSGYRTGPIGKPEDKSSMDKMLHRHSIICQSKREFKKITTEANLKEKSRGRSAKCFDLAAAPVAKPSSSKHSTGYALDIEGNNSDIKSTSRSLGATLVFDEKSHVHVEFKNGVA